jgi:hypothetical protein
MTFDELREMVVGLWLVAEPDNEFVNWDEDEARGEYEFKDFIRGGSYNIPVSDHVKYIEHEGGGEGGSEDCESVIQVGGVFYKIIYSYASYEGFDWDFAEVEIVKPVERVVTFYESI